MRRIPFATLTLAALVLVVYGVELASGVEPFCLAYGFAPEHPTFANAFVSMFLHAGLTHMFGNIAALLLLGALVESEIGPSRLIRLFVASGLAGAAMHGIFAPPGSILVGSSAGILGLLPLGMVLWPRALLAFGVCFFGMHFVALFVETPLFPATTSIGAHIAGFSIGTVFAFVHAARDESRLSVA